MGGEIRKHSHTLSFDLCKKKKRQSCDSTIKQTKQKKTQNKNLRQTICCTQCTTLKPVLVTVSVFLYFPFKAFDPFPIGSFISPSPLMKLGLFLLARCGGQLRYDRVGFRCSRPEEPLVCSLWARAGRAVAGVCCVPMRWGRRNRASARRRKRSDGIVRRAGTLASSSSSPLHHPSSSYFFLFLWTCRKKNVRL